MRISNTTVLSALGAVLMSGSLVQADVFSRVAVLTGSQEVPATTSTATGYARFSINTQTNTVTYRIVFTGLSSGETAAHIHGFANPGVAAPVIVPLAAGNVKVGSFTYAEPDEANYLNGLAYVNVHSVNFPGGEIRGQIVSAVAMLDGGQESPPVPTSAKGFGLFNFNTTTHQMSYYISYTGLSSAETAAHVHGYALPGVAASVLIPLPGTNPKVGTLTYPAADEQKWLDGLTYVNVHTSNFGGGEIRGQIVSSVNPIDGTQETPPLTVAGAGGSLISYDRAANTLGFDISFANLGSAQTAAHFHGFSPPGVASGVVFNLGTGTSKRGTWAFGAANAANIFNGQIYTNAHSTVNGGGELRGQVLPGSLLPCSPLITSDPVDQPVNSGDMAMFTVGADPRTGGTPSYRWYYNNGALVDGGAYSGSFTATLMVMPATSAEEGLYHCVVSNSCGDATSADARLMINSGGGCDPDVNMDGNVDQDDVAYLINVVGGGDNPTGIDPDFNQDGNVDQDDIASLINTVGGGGCP